MGFEGGLHIGKKRGVQFSTALSQDITPADLAGLSLWMDANDTTTINAKLAAEFTAANSEYLSSTNSVFSVGNEDFTIGGWVKLKSSALQMIWSRWEGSFTNRSFAVYVNGSNKVLVELSSDGVTSSSFTTTFTLTTGQWAFVVVSYDSVNDLIKVSVDGATFQTQSNSTGAFSSAVAPFVFGVYNGTSLPLNGIIDSAFFYKKALSQSQVTALYNSGNGVAYENLSVDQLTNLTEWWKLNERSGVRVGVHNGYNLTDNNTVTYNLGKVSEPITANDYVWSWVDKSANLYVLSQDTAASQPQWKENGFGTNNMPYISFDGTDDGLALVIADIFSSHSQGTMFMVFTRPDITSSSVQSVLASSDAGGTTSYIAFYESNTSPDDEIGIAQRNNDTLDLVTGETTPQTINSQPMLAMIKSNGSAYSIRVNTITQTLRVSGSNNGDWFADTSGRDNLTIGCQIRSTTTYGKYNIAEIVYTNEVLTSKKIKQMEDYFSVKYGTF